jgi:hypothetical protein
VPGRNMPRAAEIDAVRFWSKVDKGPDCWLWTASVSGIGRGHYRVGSKMEQAHRVAWELMFGSRPIGLLRSRCGNLQCVRPDHQVVAERKLGPRRLAMTTEMRFAAMVMQGQECWRWTGSIDHRGHGQFSERLPGEGRRMVRAHRFAWQQAFGAIPDAADVLHRCGHRDCVRPDHLVLRMPAEGASAPTPGELNLLRAWVSFGMRRGSLRQAASEVGIAYQTARNHMRDSRMRMGVTSTRGAVEWLDEHEPGWRRVS